MFTNTTVSVTYSASDVFAMFGNWFLPTLTAFTFSFIHAKAIVWVGLASIVVMSIIILIILHQSQVAMRKMKSNESLENEDEDEIDEQASNPEKALDKYNNNTVKAIISTSKAYILCFEGFFNNDRHQLKKAMTETEEFNAKAKSMKDDIYKNIIKLQQDSFETGHFYVQVVDYIREMAHSLHFTVEPVYSHFENKHKPFTKEQQEQFTAFTYQINEFFNYNLHLLKERNFDLLEDVIVKRNILVEHLLEIEKSQIKRIKNKEVSTRNSMLYFKIISETKNLLFHLVNVVKAQRDFIQNSELLGEK